MTDPLKSTKFKAQSTKLLERDAPAAEAICALSFVLCALVLRLWGDRR